jgi:hypothetical protein
VKNWPLGLWHSLSGTGLLLGTLFFAASLTPSLIPRSNLTQGVLGGGVFTIGYGVGVFWRWLWSYMELPTPEARTLRIANVVIASLCAATAAAFLWRTTGWQNSIRKLMELDPVASAPDQGMRGRGGDLRDPAGARAAVHAYLPLHRRAFPPFCPATCRQRDRSCPRTPAVLVDRHRGVLPGRSPRPSTLRSSNTTP